ncbi:hypothetical protein AMK27_38330 [Streptomyces sp. CB02009]|uniref:DNA polymerase Y family protein n=1 Tax=Streptomyces sp. CB02009 TaxID=1703938 RepID=UPI00093DE0E3|nr:hypothetical protein [Streptomyces sp. CB02009]OKJ48629.1 hypothetical protein AMK27_38330 [Streptomyces sp. CB02009]
MTGASVIWHVRCRPDTSPKDYRHVLDLLTDFTPQVQPLPPLAALAQVRGSLRLFGVDAGELAARFRVRALVQAGVDTHIGVADTWATAATASARVGRSGVLHLPDHRAVEHFLSPLPIQALHGIGPAQAGQLQRYGLHTIGALAAMDETVVCRILGGKAGRTLRARARGIDPRAVAVRKMPESASESFGFDRDVYDPVLVRAALLDLAVILGDRIRARGQTARGLTLAVRLAGGGTAERTKRLPQPSAHTEDLRTGTLRLLDAMAFQRARIRCLTLTAEDLRPAEEGPGTQLSLDHAREARLRLEPVIDKLNARFGHRVAGPAAAYRKAS